MPSNQPLIASDSLTDFSLPEFGIYAVFPGNRYVPQRVRLLVDFLVERIRPEPYWDSVALFGGSKHPRAAG